MGLFNNKIESDAEIRLRKRTEKIVSVAVVFVVGLLFAWSFNKLNYNWNWSAVYVYREKFYLGFINTLWISFSALLLSVLFGFIIAYCLESGNVLLRVLARLYIELIRGTPLLVQILIFFYVIASSIGLENRYFVGILNLAFFSAAYISEIFRAGIKSVGQTQLESARAIGLTNRQTLIYVVIPQAARVVLPPLAGQFVSLIKDSSLLSIIAISELTLNAQEVNSFTYSSLESYLPLAFGYLLMTFPISLWIRRIERRVQLEN